MPQMHWYQQLFTRRMLICVFTGFSSGLPLYLLLNLVPAWLKTEQIDLKAIGLLSLVQFPYTWKFIWSPLIDRYPILNLGRRRGWMLISQLALIVAIAALGFFLATNLAVDDCVSGFWRGLFQCQSGYCAGCVSSRDLI